MKKILSLLMAFAVTIMFAACGGENDAATDAAAAQKTDAAKADAWNGKRVLIAYFSRADENIHVGEIQKGNTRILAEMLADMTGGDLFEIKPAKAYPKEYTPTTEIAKQEKADNARPAIEGTLPNVQDYDVIFLGYPIWWSDLPMAVYTFIEAENFSGKTVAPFCTHEGSGLAGTEGYIADATKAKVLPGLEMRGSIAQNSPDEAKAELQNWLDRIKETK